MNDEILRSHVVDLLEKIERVFSTEWRKTKLNLDPEMIEHFVDPKGTFLAPESATAMIPWPSRDELLVTYRLLVQELHVPSATPAVPAIPPNMVTKPVTQIIDGIDNSPLGSTIEVVPPIARREVPSAPIQAPPVPQPPSVTPQPIAAAAPQQLAPPCPPLPVGIPQVMPQPTPPTKKTAADIPKPVLPSMGGAGRIPGPGNMPQWPGIMTAPIHLSPIGVGGAAAALGGNVTTKTPTENFTPAAVEAPEITACKSKFAHLLHGVKSEVIRNFILAEGTNTGTDKPTIIIYCIDAVWQEFAFDYDEGKRILNKYPQRDGELIDFIKVAGHLA